MQLVPIEYAALRLNNLFSAWAKELKRILARLGLPSAQALVGRTDLLMRMRG